MYQLWLNGGIKLMVAKEFRCKYSQTQSTFAVLNIVMRWATFRATFYLRGIEKVHVTW